MLRVEAVSVVYDGAIVALQQVSLAVEQGALVALLGPNGAGKTTLMKAVAGMLPFELGAISAGRIVLDGERLDGAGPAAIGRRGVALVQDGRQCFRSLTVGENLRAASLQRRRGAAERLAMALGYFPMLGEMRDRPAGLLSGGQLQMLVIAMALMTAPRLLMLDEPSLGLSPLMVQSVFDAIARLRHELDVTVVVAEQTVPRLLAMASDVCVLAGGRVVLRAAPAAIDAATLQRLYLS